ncbi:toll-interacting protein-like isoform X2 [Convolutriloba macropyga]|uniref:toll-interacting protein-like isoform X2 n=1 Tax=Convolutriloba macropyga TaxID=536237 RepID=UPI003F526BA9
MPFLGGRRHHHRHHHRGLGFGYGYGLGYGMGLYGSRYPYSYYEDNDEEEDPMAPGYQYVQVPVYNVWTDPNVLGQLALTVERASLTKNYGLTNMSPYCRIRVGHNMCKTKTVDGAGKTPCWNQRIALPLTKGVDMAYIEIFDSCVLQNDQMVAWGCVPIPEELLIAGGDEASKAYSLSGKQGPNLEGTVHVRLSFVLSKDMAAMGNASQPQPYTMMMPPGGAAMYTPYAPYQMYPPPVMTPYAMAGTTNVHVQPQNYPQMQGTMPQPQQPRAPPVISEADVTSLKETFPAVDREVIAGVLENCSGNKDAAAELLLQMG